MPLNRRYNVSYFGRRRWNRVNGRLRRIPYSPLAVRRFRARAYLRRLMMARRLYYRYNNLIRGIGQQRRYIHAGAA